MTKTEFIKKYGERGMCVTFKSTSEIDDFLKKCESFGIRWFEGQLATQYKGIGYRNNCSIAIENDKIAYRSTGYPIKVAYELIVTPRQMIKNGWMGESRVNGVMLFLPSANVYVRESTGNSFDLNKYNTDLSHHIFSSSDIMKLYDTTGALQWTRQEKSAHDLEIERIEAELKAQAEITKKLADDLAKLKGLPY